MDLFVRCARKYDPVQTVMAVSCMFLENQLKRRRVFATRYFFGQTRRRKLFLKSPSTT